MVVEVGIGGMPAPLPGVGGGGMPAPLPGAEAANQRVKIEARAIIDLSVTDSGVAWRSRLARDAVIARLIASQRTGCKRWTAASATNK